MASAGLFPDVMAVGGIVCLVFTAPVAHPDDEIEVQATGHGQRVAVFQAHGVVHLLPKRAAWFTTQVPRAARLEVVGEKLAVESYVMSYEQFLLGTAPEIPAYV